MYMRDRRNLDWMPSCRSVYQIRTVQHALHIWQRARNADCLLTNISHLIHEISRQQILSNKYLLRDSKTIVFTICIFLRPSG